MFTDCLLLYASTILISYNSANRNNPHKTDGENKGYVVVGCSCYTSVKLYTYLYMKEFIDFLL